MASLKSLKAAIKEKDYVKAEETIATLDAAGSADVQVFLLGVFCALELKKQNVALHYVSKARAQAPGNLAFEVAKAECAIYEAFPDAISKSSFSVVEKVIENSSTSEDKRAKLKKLRWVALLKLGLNNAFLALTDISEALHDVDVCAQLVSSARHGVRYPQDVQEHAFLVSESKLSKADHLYGVCLFSGNADEEKFIKMSINHALTFGLDDQNIFKAALTPVALALVENGVVPAELEPLLAKLPQGKPASVWLDHLFAGEFDKAYLTLHALPVDVYSRWPFCGLAVYTFQRTRQFDLALNVFRANRKQFPETTATEKLIWRVFEVEAAFENHGDVAELRKLAREISDDVDTHPKIREIYLRCRLATGDLVEDEDVRQAGQQLSKDVLLELLAEAAFARGDRTAARVHAEEAGEGRWRARLIAARCLEDEDDAEDELRQITGSFPFVADAWAALARLFVQLEDLETAQRLIDHAVMLNASRQDLRRLQDEIYAALERPLAERVDNLNAFIAKKPYCMWAVKHVTLLEIQSGNLDEAVRKLKRVIHALPEDVDSEVRSSAAAIWSHVGLVNYYCGHTLSTMYAFETAVSLEPANPHYLLQLALAQRNLYMFEKAFYTLRELRAVHLALTPAIATFVQRLFLETIVLYARDLPPGAAQLKQLLVFFEVVSVVPAKQWTTKALGFSIAEALRVLRTYNADIVSAVISEVPAFFGGIGVGEPHHLVEAEVAIVLNVLSLEVTPGALNEAGLRVLDCAKETQSSHLAEIARRMFRKAIMTAGSQPTSATTPAAVSPDTDKSDFYVNLGVSFFIDGGDGKPDFSRALHCFLRAVQLHKANTAALSLIGFVAMQIGDWPNATEAFQAAHVIDPEQVEHWCGRAMLGERDLTLSTSAIMNNYQHSLSIRPCAEAVKAFTYYFVLAKAKGATFSKEVFFDFTSVYHVFYTSNHDDALLYSLAVLAENFRHFNEAQYLISRVSPALVGIEATRARIATSVGALNGDTMITLNLPVIDRLHIVYNGSLPESIAAAGMRTRLLVTFLLHSLSSGKWEIFWRFFRNKCYPLIVALFSVLDLKTNWGRGIHATLRENRPPHKLLEVFPIETPKNEYESKRCARIDDLVFRRYDPAVEPLFALLNWKNAEHKAALAYGLVDLSSAADDDDQPVLLMPSALGLSLDDSNDDYEAV